MANCERFNKTQLHLKEELYSSFNIEHISDTDYKHARRAWTGFFEINDLGEYHNLYFQSDTLLLARIFESFRNKFLEIYELDPAHLFIISTILVREAYFKKTGVELELLIDTDMMLMIERKNTWNESCYYKICKSQ